MKRPSLQLKPWPVGVDGATFKVDVESGTWSSRFMLESFTGQNVLCHTFRPNVSMDLTKRNGHAFEIRWSNLVIRQIPKWQMYVHDLHEDVVLDRYLMRSLPSLTFRNFKETDDPNPPYAWQAVGKIVPRMVVRTEDWVFHPCKKEPE
jgi:hypothetical protein